MLDIGKFIEKTPHLYHMAHASSWPSIRQHGLLSAKCAMDLNRINADLRTEIAKDRQKKSVPLPSGLLGPAGSVVIRDQIPLSRTKLRAVLDPSFSIEDWLGLLDNRVFLWAQRASLDGLLGARSYRSLPQTVITLDTRSVFEAYGDLIEVTDINTGSVLFQAPKRGRWSFQRPDSYNRTNKRQIVEVTVPHRIQNIEELAVSVIHREPNGTEHSLFAKS